MQIKISIDAPELAEAINNLALAICSAGNVVLFDYEKEDTKVEEQPKVETPQPKEEAEPALAKEEKKAEPIKEESNAAPAKEVEKAAEKEEPKITLEVVRGKLTDFMRDAKEHQEKVQGAIKDLGVSKLTEVDPKDYQKLLEAVGLSA
ncbi:hypothetical protein BEP19_16010 [Ammoniphilus oxalaticus]|uniref:rRNA biogenesis protein rrp5 n=1 Tax=Ammoniphilus oxalaticus TaxID=66863 RepID=A0A419SQN9_9BACL|nr:hypothetical protein [Ammoniphilus oxalaticus]RKD26708.1 hypothetical protein BEP19_16010 [Ammoniphilus oxalaticus]